MGATHARDDVLTLVRAQALLAMGAGGGGPDDPASRSGSCGDSGGEDSHAPMAAGAAPGDFEVAAALRNPQ